jgi:tetratricopeptide (TPR) repeat protein
MKRIFIALAILLSVQAVNAQVKTPEAARKAVESAEEAAQNPKKNLKVATWLKLAEAYMNAYDAPVGNVILNTPRVQLQYMLGNEKPVAVEDVVIDGQPFKKEVYSNKNLYFDGADVVRLVEVTVPVYEDPLANALQAYVKAYEVDVKKSKEKDIKTGMEAIAGRYLNDAFNSYQFGKYAEASELFAKSADAAASAPLNKVDTTALYNAGFTAWMVQDYNRAQNFFEKCLANNYYYEGGEVFAKLGDVYAKLGDKEKGRDILEQGFTKFPQSQSILIGLINYYMESGQNTDRLFSLINEAKKNEPDNASLYYVEGNIYKELGQNDNAIASYYKCADINPNYEFGYIGAGILYYNLALEYQEKAQNELDDKKYEALVEQFNASLKSALDPFEKAYNLSKDNELRVNVAEYLKNIYYRFSSDSDEFMAGYKKYDEVVKTGQAK